MAPLTEMNDHFGYIFKSKRNATATSLVGVMQFAGVILLILAITFIIIYTYISKLVAKTLPYHLDNLVRWIESEMYGNKSENIQLHFKELEDLKGKIAEVIERSDGKSIKVSLTEAHPPWIGSALVHRIPLEIPFDNGSKVVFDNLKWRGGEGNFDATWKTRYNIE